MRWLNIQDKGIQIIFISVNPKQQFDSSNNKITNTNVILFQQTSLLNKWSEYIQNPKQKLKQPNNKDYENK